MANCFVTWTYIFLAGLLIRQNIDFVIAMGLCEFEDLMMKNAGGGQDQRDTISTLGTDMSDQSATTVYSTDGMRISPSTDEMTTVMPKTDETTLLRSTNKMTTTSKNEVQKSSVVPTDTISTLGTDMSDQSATTVYSTDGMRISPSTDEMPTPSKNLLTTTGMLTTDTVSTLGTDMSDQSATTVYSTDGMKISPSTDEMPTPSKNLLSSTGMLTTGERIKQETTLEGIKSTWMPSTDEMRLLTSTVDTLAKTTDTSTIGLSTTRMPTTESCPNNMIWMNCSCQTTCDDPDGLNGCFKSCDDEPGYTCVCSDGFLIRDGACIPLEECGCYHPPTGVISNGSSHVNLNCTRLCTCENDVLHCEEYSCSHNTTCQNQGQSSYCECKESYWGNGTTCQVITNCQDVYNNLSTEDGIYSISPPSWPHEPFQVYCKDGWMLCQKRVSGSVSFYETWNNYRDGFGDLNSSFWLGNEKLHVISAQRDHQLRIDIWFNNTNDDSSYLHYNLFRVSSEATQYEITLGSYTGSYEYDYMDYHRDMKFSTYDQDNDLANQNCAHTQYHPGGWWFNGCHAIMLNGIYGAPWDTGICLFQRITRDKNCSVVAVDMKIKPL
ncbi:uncharacterized protein [Apostichopus japonicus]|uniref:uncharacterized protein isoform X2 n=1 Tax=Stichopus japonicus TaxID=307972 RepID=UPI003AB62AC3